MLVTFRLVVLITSVWEATRPSAHNDALTMHSERRIVVRVAAESAA